MRALPEDVLVLVLRHVNQAERLSACALVSTGWAKAAAMASDAIDICTDNEDKLMPWLRHHGSHVTRFTCAYNGAPDEKEVFSMLPCRNLQDLTLYKWEVVLLEPMHGVLCAATGLTGLHLVLEESDDLWEGGLSACTALHALPALQHFDLSVQRVKHYGSSDEDLLPSGVISGLTTLTRLELRGGVALVSLQPFSCLTRLQHLNLNLGYGVVDTANAVQSGQQPFKQLQALTHLLSMRLKGGKLVSTSSSPAFSGCSGLQEICLNTPVDASAFHGLTVLTKLHVWASAFLESAPSGSAGVVALLGHISRMQQLQDFALVRGHPATAVSLRHADAAACGAIPASANLKCFDLTGLWLPRASWAYIFPPGRRLLQLQKFELCFSNAGGVDTALLDCSAFEHLVDCCPAIQELSFQNLSLFEQDVSLAPLLRLQQLARLECPHVVDGAASVGVLARLSFLRNLRLYASAGLTDVGLLQLTALTGLQELHVIDDRDFSLSFMEVMPRGRSAAFVVSTLEGLPSCRALLDDDCWQVLGFTVQQIHSHSARCHV